MAVTVTENDERRARRDAFLDVVAQLRYTLANGCRMHVLLPGGLVTALLDKARAVQGDAAPIPERHVALIVADLMPHEGAYKYIGMTYGEAAQLFLNSFANRDAPTFPRCNDAAE